MVAVVHFLSYSSKSRPCAVSLLAPSRSLRSDRERRVTLVMAHFLRAAEFNMDFPREVLYRRAVRTPLVLVETWATE